MDSSMPLVKHLKETEPFSLLPDAIRDEICSSAVLKKFSGGTYIFKQNDPPTGFLYVIKEGLIEITELAPGGEEMVVDYRNEGNLPGGPTPTERAPSKPPTAT
jgi:CBS domain-containing protein